MGEKIGVTFLGLFLGGIAAALLVPVIWFISRAVGLVAFLLSITGSPFGLMVFGGIVIGALVGALAMALTMRVLSESNRLAVVSGAIGGAVVGAGSSIMFFPIVAIL